MFIYGLHFRPFFRSDGTEVVRLFTVISLFTVMGLCGYGVVYGHTVVKFYLMTVKP